MKKTKGKNDNKVKYGTVSLPIPLIERIKDKIKGTGMGSVSAYVTFVLRQILVSSPPFEDLDESKEENVRKNLKKLGYL
ncbi:MAG: CopG family transcriptional regulator [Candidatus Pacearchaeota archaeon]|nr:CopG family transcriptional regulator [Candidatus Pacearchaeota archaeon]